MLKLGKRTEILISGFGGQGVVRMGQIISLAAVYYGHYATMLVSHGTETRGGYVRSQVVISEEFVDSPVVENADYFCALSRAAFNKFKDSVKQGIIMYDPWYIEPDNNLKVKQVPLNARDLAINELGGEIFANTIILGSLCRLTSGLFDKDTMIKAMMERINKYPEENKKAFELGYSLF